VLLCVTGLVLLDVTPQHVYRIVFFSKQMRLLLLLEGFLLSLLELLAALPTVRSTASNGYGVRHVIIVSNGSSLSRIRTRTVAVKEAVVRRSYGIPLGIFFSLKK
jgi:hypothetical protein